MHNKFEGGNYWHCWWNFFSGWRFSNIVCTSEPWFV